MAHTDQLPPLWPFFDDLTNETFHLIILEEFTEMVNGCAPDALVWIFHHPQLQEAHATIAEDQAEGRRPHSR